MSKRTGAWAIAWLAVAFSQAPATTGARWNYSNESGPARWGELEPAFALCATGVNQSPIDLGATIESELPPLEIAYGRAGTEILNNGHTIQVNVEPGNILTVDGKKFTLKQFHFHSPSEHTVMDKPYALEAHFVHSDDDGHIAVIGILFREGEANPEVAKLWGAMPTKPGPARALPEPVDPSALLPSKRDYFRYNGSLTTPPCTEGVRWFVMKEPLTVSKAQVFHFLSTMHGFNNRPVQPVNARPILR
jgi:carbonic anhydrase